MLSLYEDTNSLGPAYPPLSLHFYMLYLRPRRGHSLYLSSCSRSVIGSSRLLLNRLRFVYARGCLSIFFSDNCLGYFAFLNHQLLHVNPGELASKIDE